MIARVYRPAGQHFAEHTVDSPADVTITVQHGVEVARVTTSTGNVYFYATGQWRHIDVTER